MFQQFGQVLQAETVRNRDEPWMNRGYGFVTFSTAEAAERALQHPCPVIDSRQTHIHYAYLGRKENDNHSQVKNNFQFCHYFFGDESCWTCHPSSTNTGMCKDEQPNSAVHVNFYPDHHA